MTYQEVYDSCLDTPYIPSEDGSHFDRRHYFYMKQNPDLLKNAFEIKSKQTEQPFSTERDNFKEKLKTFMKMTKQLKISQNQVNMQGTQSGNLPKTTLLEI